MFDDFDQKLISDLNSGLEKLPRYKGEALRGLAIKDEHWNDFLNMFNNDTVMSREYWSSTSNHRVANEFMKRYPGNRVMLHIQSETGSVLGRYSNVVTEDEVLFKNNTLFNVLKINDADDGIKHIYLQEIQ